MLTSKKSEKYVLYINIFIITVIKNYIWCVWLAGYLYFSRLKCIIKERDYMQMDVFSASAIKNMYKRNGVTPPKETDSFQIRLEKQSKLYEKQLVRMKKITSNFEFINV